MKRSAFVGLLALGFVVLAGARQAHSAGEFIPRPIPIGGWVVDPPPLFEPPIERPSWATVNGTIKLRPKGVDLSWCTALKVTAHVMDVFTYTNCQDYGSFFGGCYDVEVVRNEHTTESYATPVTADRRVWQYDMTIATYDNTRVELSAQCEPAYEYQYHAKGTASKPFAVGAGHTVTRNMRLRLSVPQSETRTVVLKPSFFDSAFESHAQGCEAGRLPDEWKSKLVVGYHRMDDPDANVIDDLFGNTCTFQEVYQALLWFDLSEIEGDRHKLLLNADLRYREDVLFYNGVEPVTGPNSCIGGLGAAQFDWTRFTDRTVRNTESATGEGPWNVLRDVAGWLAYPETNYGFVIKSDDESFANNGITCMSAIEDPELVVTYLAIADVPIRF